MVPGSSERFLAKALELPCDMVLIDLEDAVAPSEKPHARSRAAAAIATGDWGDRIVGVRINSLSSPYALRDLTETVAAAGERLDVVVVAKTSDPFEVRTVEFVLGQLESELRLAPGHFGIEALIESAQGLANVASIAAASARLEAIAFGPGDLAASLGMAIGTVGDVLAEYPGDHFHAVCLALLVAGRTNGLQVIDGPYLGLADRIRLETMARRTRALGFDGKWAIHPDQIETLNALYSPTEAEVLRAKAMLDALERAEQDERRGAIRHDGEMFDEVNRKMARAVLERALRSSGASQERRG